MYVYVYVCAIYRDDFTSVLLHFSIWYIPACDISVSAFNFSISNNVLIFQDGKRYYQVKWRDSWEPEERLMAACESALQAFWKEYYANVEKEIRKQVVIMRFSNTDFVWYVKAVALFWFILTFVKKFLSSRNHFYHTHLCSSYKVVWVSLSPQLEISG